MRRFVLIFLVLTGLLLSAAISYAIQGKKQLPSEVLEVVTQEPGASQVTLKAPHSRTGEQIDWQVISSGGTDGSSTNFQLVGTVAQTAVGTGSSPNFGLSHGYWQEVAGSGGGCCDNRADINHDGQADPDIADLIYMVSYMFQEGPEPPCDEPYSPECPDHYFAEADVNGDGTCSPDIADLIYLVTFMFQEGPVVVPCP